MTGRWRVRTAGELVAVIDTIGFLPLYDGSIPGFSVQSFTPDAPWWSGSEEHDPWMWRVGIVAQRRAVYGKLLEGRTAFVSRGWYPQLANLRRDGYDPDARYEDGLLSRTCLDIYRCLAGEEGLTAQELRRRSHVRSGFDGALAKLQMLGYVAVGDMRRPICKTGKAYGFPVSLYATSERLLGADTVRAAYQDTPQQSAAYMADHLQALLPEVPRERIERFLAGSGGPKRSAGPHGRR